MSLQSEIAGRLLEIYPNSIVKKVDRDNHLDIHIPEIHEKKGTHIFFNTSKDNIKVGFYCRDEEFVESILVNNEQTIERYSQGVRIKDNPVFDSIDEALEAAFSFINVLTGNNVTVKTTESQESEVEEEEDDKGYPVIAWASDSEISRDFIMRYADKWQVKSELYSWRAGINGFLPDWMDQLVDRNIFYSFSPSQIEQINTIISEDSIIPVLEYVPSELYMHTKRVWWMVPFCIWRNDVASFLFMDKNGIYAMYRDSMDEIQTNMIFPWDRIEEIDFIEEFEDDPNVVRLDLYADNGGQLSFDEFVSDTKGSYLKIVESIYKARKKTIEASKDGSTWYEGAGGEGFKSFANPTDLLDEFKWLSPSRPNPSFYGYDGEIIEHPVKEWPNEFMIAVSIIADQKFGYCNAKGSADDLYQVLKHKLFDGEWDLVRDNWPKGYEIYKDIYTSTDTWEGVYENLKNYFDEKIGFSSKLSEYKLASVFYELWLYTASENVLQIDFEYDDLKPLMEITFSGPSSSGLPFGYMMNNGKPQMTFIKNLYKVFGEKYLWRAFLSNLGTPLQFVQIAGPLALDGAYNHIDSKTAEYILNHNGYGSPHINSYVLGGWDWYDKIKQHVKQNPAVIGSLFEAEQGVEMTARFISENEIEELKFLAISKEVKVKLKLDSEDLKENSGLDTLLYDLPSGNEISLKMWVFSNKKYSRQDYLEQLENDRGWVEILINKFASKLISEAESFTFSTKFDTNDVPGSEYLKNYATWEIEVDGNKYSKNCLTVPMEISLEDE